MDATEEQNNEEGFYATEEQNNQEEYVADAKRKQADPDRNTADSLENTGVETIDDPVSQLEKPTGVGTVDDPDNILQSDTDQWYGE